MKKGFTLIEIVVAMTVLAVILYSALAIFILAATKGVDVEVFTVAQLLAEREMEEISGRSFASLGSGGTPNFGGGLGEYSSEIRVAYVDPATPEVSVDYRTNLKKISVLIYHPQLNQPVSLEALRGNY